MLELADSTDPDSDSGMLLNFALGKVFADLGEFRVGDARRHRAGSRHGAGPGGGCGV